MATIPTFARVSNLRVRHIAVNAILVSLWLWFYRPIFDYLAIIFTHEDFRTNQIVLIGVIALIATQTRRERFLPQFDAPPQPYPPALALALGGSICFLLVERLIDINTISASLFALASYGLLGLWMPPQRWRDGLPAALLLVGVLPFGEHMQTFVGYPMRILTATIARDGLAAAGISSIGVDTILILENGVSQIDLPCSGVKSLWTGALFLIAATWIERRALSARWLLVAGAFAAILFVTNLVRVALLVIVGQVLGLRLVAEMMHVPLGVLGFIVACASAVLLLRSVPRAPIWAEAESSVEQPAWFSLALIAAIFGLTFLYSPRPHDGLAQSPPPWNFPSELVTQAMPLKPDEVAWLTRDGAESADRRAFDWRGIKGSMILVPSTTWRAHHRPERCFEVYGLELDDSRAHLVEPGFSVRFVSLGQRLGSGLSATYWFQSAERATDDYGTRMWADLAPHRERWVLVSILFERTIDPNSSDIKSLYLTLRDAVAQNLTKEN